MEAAPARPKASLDRGACSVHAVADEVRLLHDSTWLVMIHIVRRHAGREEGLCMSSCQILIFTARAWMHLEDPGRARDGKNGEIIVWVNTAFPRPQLTF